MQIKNNNSLSLEGMEELMVWVLYTPAEILGSNPATDPLIFSSLQLVSGLKKLYVFLLEKYFGRLSHSVYLNLNTNNSESN